MKNFKLIGFLIILASSFMFIQCTSDPIPGTAGVDGINGIDGTDGIDGVDGVGVQECIACHSDTHRDPIYAAYDLSGHAAGGAVGYAGSRASCAQCHSNEGYLEYQTKGTTQDYTNPTRIDCKTCHSSHKTFDFENDGADYALRNTDSETLLIDGITMIDFEGTSNMCISCHQPRNSYPVPTGTDPIEITSKRYGPHHGPQSSVLEGILTANIVGSEGYPGSGANGDNTHRKGASCVSCHMGASEDTATGTHTWWPTENTCTACHTNGAPSEVTGYTADMATLKQLLIDKGILLEDDYVVTGTFPATEVQAVWNYRTLLEDKSNGVHNPKLAKALLKNSIEALQ